jgi:hypothetical protein
MPANFRLRSSHRLLVNYYLINTQNCLRASKEIGTDKSASVPGYRDRGGQQKQTLRRFTGLNRT